MQTVERAPLVGGVVRAWKPGIGQMCRIVLAARDRAFEPVHAGLPLIGGRLPRAVLRERGGGRAQQHKKGGAMD